MMLRMHWTQMHQGSDQFALVSKTSNHHFTFPKYKKCTVVWIGLSAQCSVFLDHSVLCTTQCNVAQQCSAVYIVQRSVDSVLCAVQSSEPQRLIIVRALYRARQKAERALGGNKNVFILPPLSSPPQSSPPPPLPPQPSPSALPPPCFAKTFGAVNC